MGRHTEPAPIDNLSTWPEPFVVPRQLADYWKFHLFTVQRWLRDGDLRGARFRGNWRIKTDDARLFEMKLFAPRKSA